MNSQESFRRIAEQIQRSAGKGGMPGGRGALTGGGLLVALVGGGLLLNASLFNGVYALLWLLLPLVVRRRRQHADMLSFVQWTVVTEPLSILGMCLQH